LDYPVVDKHVPWGIIADGDHMPMTHLFKTAHFCGHKTLPT